MPNSSIDYLTIGHLTKDLAGNDYLLGGTAAYASLTALAFGLNPAVISSNSSKIDLGALSGVEIINKPGDVDTTFENIETAAGRKQILHQTARRITKEDIPNDLHKSPIVHLGPVADEVDMEIISVLTDNCLVGITPQGWMRRRGENGDVSYQYWQPAEHLARRADAVIISDEDVQRDESTIHDYAQLFRLLVVTEGFNGARVYWHGDVRHFSAPQMNVLDPTGAGDIFAAAFLIRLKATRNPWKAAETAVHLASLSVTRKGLDSIPTIEEVKSSLLEIIKGSPSQ